MSGHRGHGESAVWFTLIALIVVGISKLLDRIFGNKRGDK